MATRTFAGAVALALGASLAGCSNPDKETGANVDSAQAANTAPPATVLTQDTSATGQADKPADSTRGEGNRLGRPTMSGDTTTAKPGTKEPRKTP